MGIAATSLSSVQGQTGVGHKQVPGASSRATGSTECVRRFRLGPVLWSIHPPNMGSYSAKPNRHVALSDRIYYVHKPSHKFLGAKVGGKGGTTVAREQPPLVHGSGAASGSAAAGHPSSRCVCKTFTPLRELHSHMSQRDGCCPSKLEERVMSWRVVGFAP